MIRFECSPIPTNKLNLIIRIGVKLSVEMTISSNNPKHHIANQIGCIKNLKSFFKKNNFVIFVTQSIQVLLLLELTLV